MYIFQISQFCLWKWTSYVRNFLDIFCSSCYFGILRDFSIWVLLCCPLYLLPLVFPPIMKPTLGCIEPFKTVWLCNSKFACVSILLLESFLNMQHMALSLVQQPSKPTSYGIIWLEVWFVISGAHSVYAGLVDSIFYFSVHIAYCIDVYYLCKLGL